MKNKMKIAFGAAALAVVMAAAGSFAWFSTKDKTNPNIFGMDNFDVSITEDFDTPDVPLLPGADITKEVGVTNSGNVDVLVRVKLEEVLELLEQNQADGTDKLKVEYADNQSPSGAQVPVLISQKMITAYDNAGYDVFASNNPAGVTVYRKTAANGANTVYSYLAYVTNESAVDSGSHHLVKVTPQGSDAANPTGFTVQYAYNLKKDTIPSNGQYKASAIHGKDDTVLDNYYGSNFHEAVKLNFDTNVSLDGTVSSDAVNWVLMNDGYFYYTKPLKGESVSAALLKSVSIKETAGNALKGATYTITPVMEAVQVDYSAAVAVWTDMAGDQAVAEAVVSANDADQLVYNIVKTGKGYYAGA